MDRTITLTEDELDTLLAVLDDARDDNAAAEALYLRLTSAAPAE